jgi:hypothetical protein
MSIFTDRELEFLYSLNTRWRRLYWNELARLLKEDEPDATPDRNPVPIPQSGSSKGLNSSLVAMI